MHELLRRYGSAVNVLVGGGEAATMHCIDRAWDRYGLQLVPTDIFKLEAQIRESKSLLVRLEGNGAAIHLVNHDGTALVAVWGWAKNVDCKRIITFLPPEAVMKGNHTARLQHSDRENRGGRNRRRARA